MNEDHISFEFIDKQFCIYAQIVDMTIEPVFISSIKKIYIKNGNIILAIVYIFSAVIILIKRQLVIFYILLKK